MALRFHNCPRNGSAKCLSWGHGPSFQALLFVKTLMAGNARSKAPTPRLRPWCPRGSWLLMRLRCISEKRLGLRAWVHLVLHIEVCQAASKRMVCPAPGQPPGPLASRVMMPDMDTEDSGGFRVGVPAGSSWCAENNTNPTDGNCMYRQMTEGGMSDQL